MLRAQAHRRGGGSLPAARAWSPCPIPRLGDYGRRRQGRASLQEATSRRCRAGTRGV
ncbi:hypothetical protein M885DRAFT_522328 [Pelagophyceae sp. CCMP2097]|nr:hypothetical protein M885DRAFT_522328 [Pelagophyceae sp. CCMP2097]